MLLFFLFPDGSAISGSLITPPAHVDVESLLSGFFGRFLPSQRQLLTLEITPRPYWPHSFLGDIRISPDPSSRLLRMSVLRHCSPVTKDAFFRPSASYRHLKATAPLLAAFLFKGISVFSWCIRHDFIRVAEFQRPSAYAVRCDIGHFLGVVELAAVFPLRYFLSHRLIFIVRTLHCDCASGALYSSSLRSRILQ